MNLAQCLPNDDTLTLVRVPELYDDGFRYSVSRRVCLGAAEHCWGMEYLTGHLLGEVSLFVWSVILLA